MIEERQISPETKEQTYYLYRKGVQCDYFILMLQGRVEISVGNENIVFEDGSFSVFGINALTCESGHQFIPDYTVKVLTTVQYLIVSRSLYRSAIRATQMERGNNTPEHYQEYDEIFWLNVKKVEKTGDLDNSGPKSDASSMKSGEPESGRSTPCKNNRSQKSSLIRRLTPKYDKRKEANIQETGNRGKRLSGQENPLIAHEVGDESVETIPNNSIDMADLEARL